MPEIQPGCHTIQSHGVKVARLHMHDWIILGLLVVLELILAVVISPFYRFVGKEMMTDLKYPLKDNTVPFWAVPVIGILVPIVIFLIIYIFRRDVYDLHHGVLGILYAVLITAVITDAIKMLLVDLDQTSLAVFPRWEGCGVICHGLRSVIKEGHKSFPSGHTSWSFAGLGFLSLYLSGKIKAFDQKGHIAKLCIVFLPLLLAALVGTSRVDDYWHHWQDVFTGGLLGLTVATFCYLQFFPAPYHSQSWGPHAYFRMLEDLRSSREQSNSDRPHLQLRDAGTNSARQEEMGCYDMRDTTPIIDMEAGRR